MKRMFVGDRGRLTREAYSYGGTSVANLTETKIGVGSEGVVTSAPKFYRGKFRVSVKFDGREKSLQVDADQIEITDRTNAIVEWVTK